MEISLLPDWFVSTEGAVAGTPAPFKWKGLITQPLLD